MTGVHIRVRTTSKGEKRYEVRYRKGGRAFKVISAGTFRTLKEARIRRDVIAGELAAYRDPALLLRDLQQPKETRTLKQAADAWLKAENTVKAFRPSTLTQYAATSHAAIRGMEDMPVDEITWRRLQTWVTDSGHLAVATLRQCRSIQRHIFDYAGVEPNPARDRRLRLPREEREEPIPPTAAHVLGILERVPAEYRLPLAVLEQTGMRVNELRFAWGDVDEAEDRIRLKRASTKTARARWVYLPDWLMRIISDTCPLEDRTPERRVFHVTDDGIRYAMKRACQLAKIPHYHPHDLRHRRISLWHAEGMPWRSIADRVGQARASVTLDTYSHVMPVDEISPETWRQILVGAG